MTADAATQAAWAAHERLDWPEAIRHWQDCVRFDPEATIAYWMGGNLLLQLGRLDEAEAMLSEGVPRDPGNVSMGISHARVATARRDFAEAARRWDRLDALAPGDKAVGDARAEAEMQMRLHRIDAALDGAEAEVDWSKPDAAAASSADAELFMQFESLGDNCEFGLAQRHFGAEPLSLLRWNAIHLEGLVAIVNDGARGIGDPGHTALELRQNNEYILVDRRFGMAMHTFIKGSEVPEGDRPGLHAKMCRRLAYLGSKLIEDFEDPSKTFVFKETGGTTLEHVRRLHEAIERHGPNRLLYVVLADADRPAGSVAEVLPRLYVGALATFVSGDRSWDTIAFDGWRHLCRNVLMLQQQGAATPTEQAIGAAWAAHARFDWAAAIERWRDVIRLDPGVTVAYWMAGNLLYQLDQVEAAEAMLSEGVRRDPSCMGMVLKHAQTATALRNWPEAARRWEALAARWPDEQEVVLARAEAEMQTRLHRIDAAIDGDDAATTHEAAALATEDAALFLRFESLGDNCEFGFAQRYFGAEPVSLLRWNSIDADALVACVADGFHAVGDPAHTELYVDALDEFMLADRRFGMLSHTFVKAGQTSAADRDGLHQRMCRRLSYLGTKLREDLEDPSKVFVFKSSGGGLDQARKLHAAMRRHGPSRLLYVVEADAARPAGTVEQVAPGLFVAALQKLWPSGGDYRAVDAAGWRALCREVLVMDSRAELVPPATQALAVVAAPEPPPAPPPPRPAWDVLRSPVSRTVASPATKPTLLGKVARLLWRP